MNEVLYTCWDCGEYLPRYGVGKCAKCANSKDKLFSAPHCPKCKTALNHWPGSKMAWANQKCKCPQSAAGKEAA